MELARKNLLEESKKDKNMQEPTGNDLFTQVTKEVAEMAADDEEIDPGILHTSPNKTQLSKKKGKQTQVVLPWNQG